jgi:allantoicase
MGDGWETKRRRGPGHDWIIVRLAARGRIDRIELDTDHFKGNAPESCMVEVCDAPDAAPEALAGARWTTILSRTVLQPDAQHRFQASAGPATHARLAIYPDGGVARLRLFGTVIE